MFRRILAAVAVGGLLIAATVGFAALQTFSGGEGIAAQGSAIAATCADDVSVEYKQVDGIVTGFEVNQTGGDNCDGLPFHASVQDSGDGELGQSWGVVNGGTVPLGPLADVEAIHHAVVTITDN